MRWPASVRLLPRLAVAVAVVFTAPVLIASDGVKGAGEFKPQDETVEFFSAIEEGKLEVKLIAKDSTECRVLIANKTDKPLNVSLPAAFAGVPVLAQGAFPPGNFDNFNNQNNQNNQNSGAQQLGIGNQFGNPFGNQIGNNVQGNRGNQLFNVPGARNNLAPPGARNFAPFNLAPEQVAQLKLASVCLDHGKPDPRPAMPYEIKPLADVTGKAEVVELCRMLGRKEVSQRAAQAAAWHLNNDMSWDELTSLRLKTAVSAITKPFFTRRELADGEKAAETAMELANEGRKDTKVDSLSLR
ncbi:MAG: hypothetical protein ABIP48_32110 [Planctomycetota bacterium]